MRHKIEIPEQYVKLRALIGESSSPNKLMTLWKTYVSPKKVSIVNRLYSYDRYSNQFNSGQFSIPTESLLTCIEECID